MEQMEFIKIDLNNPEHCMNFLKLLNDYMEDEIGLGKSMPEKMGPQIINGLKNHPAFIGFFAFVNGEYAALANCNINFSSWQAMPLINIHDFVVSPAFRGKGAGLFLLNKIEEYALKEGYCRINLEVRYDNLRAQKLYLKAGFDECDPPNLFWEKRLK
ncbi:GNAT family N-acetyltransferase [Mariniphaga sp.]|uniref:GNAT family N-acetyltransferase n=1 Tax=Mariniphaga sp. TaxID=1954475 RepID=UPI003566F07C